MKLLVIIGLLGLVGLVPFVVIRRPWAVRIWSKVKFIVVAYAIAILVIAVYRLATGWDDIYG